MRARVTQRYAVIIENAVKAGDFELLKKLADENLPVNLKSKVRSLESLCSERRRTRVFACRSVEVLYAVLSQLDLSTWTSSTFC
jgi:hypothetical protein